MRTSAVDAVPAPVRVRRPILFAAPHRVLFLAGAVQLLATILFWFVELAGRFTAWWAPPPITVPAVWTHAFLMLFGLFPFFIFGFLMTTYPKWLDRPPIPAAVYLPAAALMFTGVVVLYAGLFLGHALVLGGVVALLLGWAAAVGGLLRVYLQGWAKAGRYEMVLTLSLTLGLMSAGAAAAWLLAPEKFIWTLMIEGGLWLFLLPILWTVSHRMIPFFGSCVLKGYQIHRPVWTFYGGIVCMAGHFALHAAGAPQWAFLVDLPLALIALRLALLWQFWRSFGIRLLAMLHFAFLWLPIALILYSVQEFSLLAGIPVLGFAPLHALGIGYAASMLLTMATRATIGHSGRPLQASALTWLCFWALQAAVLLRIAADLPAAWGLGGPAAALWAAAVWLTCFALWSARHVPTYWRPRADGRPG